jgi:TolB-like protein/Tfp pilus assembly protein PilF
VDRARVWCDVLLFEVRLDQGRSEEALDLYRGEFLPSLHVSEAIGFERWQQGEGWRLQRQAREAAASLADAAEAGGNLVAAARWLERALEIMPTDEVAVRRLLRLLDRAGDRAGAVRAYERFAETLREEYGTSPAPETEAVVAAVRSRSTPKWPPTLPVADVARPPIQSIAVLPLHNLTGKQEQQYFVDGLTEMLTSELAAIGTVRVISTQSAKTLQSSPGLLSELGERLGVDAVIEGSVLRAGRRVRVTVQLVRVEPEEHIWADAYDWDLRDVLALYSDVAASVAREVGTRLTSEARRRLEARPRPVEPVAYDHFLRGVALFGQSAYADALGQFQQAVGLDPTFPEAHAWDALAWGTLALAGLVGPEVAERMSVEAERAVELDPDLGTAHQAHAYSLQLFERDWDGAERAYGRALGAGRRDPRGLGPYILFLVGQGRFEEALARADELLRSDPGAAPPHMLVGWALHKARRFDESVDRLEFALANWPDFAWTPPFLAASHAFLDRPTEAIAVTRRALATAPDFATYLGYGAATFARAGARDEAVRALRRLQRLREGTYVDPFHLAVGHAGLGDYGQALEELERLVVEGSPSSWVVAPEPFFDPLRADPRFRNVLRDLRLPELSF